MTGAPINLTDALELLGYDRTEFYQLCTQLPGGPFTTEVINLGATAYEGIELPVDRDVWFSVNPTAGPARANAGRGGATDVTRLAGIWVDLDVKAAGCATFDVAHAIIDDLSGILGSTPAFITESGHGLQPVWAVDGMPIREPGDVVSPLASWPEGIKRAEAAALLRRWGKLVATVADRRGARVDSLYDLPRVLRCPGTVNHKQPDQPVPVVTRPGGGSPLDVDRIAEILDEYGVPRQSEDATDSGVVLSAPAEWQLGDRTCNYAKTITAGWATDTPSARHPWLVAQATRLAAMHRNGCLTPATHRDAENTLIARFNTLVGGQGDRGTTVGEIRGALAFGVERTAAMTAEHLAGELGRHLHDEEPGDRIPVRVGTLPVRHLQPVPSTTAAPPVPPRNEAAAGLDHKAPTARPGTIPPPPPPSWDGERRVRRHHLCGRGVYGPGVRLMGTSRTSGEFSRKITNLATVTQLVTDTATDLESLTDRGNADLLAQRHHPHLRYVPASKLWLEWDGHRWRTSADDGPAIAAAIETIDSLQPLDGEQRKHKHQSQSARALNAAAGLASRHPLLRVDDDQLDADPYALNTPAGTIDLRTGAVRPCDPAELHTLTTLAGYDPAATAPIFEQFLEQTMPDPDLRAYVQRLAGYSANGAATEHYLPFLHGPGANGKSVLLNVIIGVLGGYATTTPPGFLLEGGRDDESAIARLRGLRLVVASEVAPTAAFDEAKIKVLTGGDLITARHLFGRHFTFTPSHTLWLAGNHQPRVDAGGESFWRRLRLIPFLHTVPREQRNPKLTSTILEQEAAGVLRWIVDGAVAAYRDGLGDPAAVLAATKTYAAEEDHLARFLSDCLVVGGDDHVKVNTRHMRAAYTDWCDGEGEKPVDPRTFARELRTRLAIQLKPSNGQRWFTNVQLVRNRGDNDHPAHPARAAAPHTVADLLNVTE